MRLIFVTLVAGLFLSACSSDRSGSNTSMESTQIPIIQPLSTNTLQPTAQASTQPAKETQPYVISSATLQIATPVTTPTPIVNQAQTTTSTTVVSLASTSSSAIIADHTVLSRFNSIPSSALAAAAAAKTLFKHQSTGNNIEYLGLQCLAGLQNDPSNFPQECSDHAQTLYSPYDNRQWDWEMWADTTSDAILKTDQWVSVVNTQQSNYQILGMKLCYVDSWNMDFDYYRQKMEQLERTYPLKKFIWSTTPLPAQKVVAGNLAMAENVQIFNQQLRAYALANNKFLYDIAAIESHDPDGNYCQSNGFEAMCDVYYDGYGGGGGGHPDVDGSIRLAKGFWWLMARINGWDGNS